jgi:predicted molibdopterin-dependent oxidoreductase YjgC
MDNGLVMINRGFRMEVGTAPDHAFDSIFSGNTVEICPVGALTAASYRFKARPWELKKTPSVCNNCSVGCNARIDSRVDKIMRLMSRNNDEIDDGWLCNRGRWEFDYVNSERRLRTPLIRRDGKLTPASWPEAISYITTRLQEIIARHGKQAVAGIGSTRTTNEEAYLFQKLLREVIGTSNIDHQHGHFPGPRDPLTNRPWMMTNSIAEIEQASHIILIGSDPYVRQPILNLRIKKALRQGARISIVNSAPTELDRLSTLKLTIPENTTGVAAKVLLKRVLEHENVNLEGREEVRAKIQREDQVIRAGMDTFGARLTTDLQSLADEIVGAKAAVILYDEQTTFEPGGKDLAADLQALAVLSGQIDRPGAGVGPLFGDANSLGARDMGLLPDALPGYKPVASPGLTYDEILSSSQIKALFVMGANPARHLPDGRLPASLELTVVQELLPTETVAQADVVLPAVSFAEKDGSMTNVDHHVQAIRRALRPLPGAQADWQILIALANALGHGWSYENSQAILQEIAERNPFYAGLSWEALGKQGVRTTREQEVSHV